jgi:hypothetical protein
MERQTFRAAHLVNNLLEFARPRARANVRADLRAVISNAAESVETTFGNRRLLFDSNGGSEPAWIMGDPRELEQVFVNLFTNARDASPDGSEVTCCLATDGQSGPRRDRRSRRGPSPAAPTGSSSLSTPPRNRAAPGSVSRSRATSCDGTGARSGSRPARAAESRPW